jgi:hypothetical protein
MENIMSDYQLLAQIYNEIKKNYISSRKEAWKDSPFSEMVPTFSIKELGELGETMFIELARRKGHIIEKHLVGNDVYDNIFCGKKVEQKFATESTDGGFTANQIRDQEYDNVIVFALTPTDVIFWVLPKEKAWSLGTWQHGTNVVKDTKLLKLRPTGKRNNKFSEYQVGNTIEHVITRLIGK